VQPRMALLLVVCCEGRELPSVARLRGQRACVAPFCLEPASSEALALSIAELTKNTGYRTP
jgi:hypothetical protein